MTEAQLYLVATLLGSVMPVLIDTLNREVENKKARFWVSFIVSGFVGVLLSIGDLRLDSLDNILTSILLVWGASQATYKNFWEGSAWQYRVRFSTKPPLVP